MKSHRKAVVGKVREELRRRHEAAGIAVEGAAKRNAPVDTGLLRSSITHDANEDGAVIGTDLHYAIFQELGTRYQPGGQPFLVPGLLESVPALQRIYGREME